MRVGGIAGALELNREREGVGGDAASARVARMAEDAGVVGEAVVVGGVGGEAGVFAAGLVGVVLGGGEADGVRGARAAAGLDAEKVAGALGKSGAAPVGFEDGLSEHGGGR